MAAPSAARLLGAVYICPNCFDDGEEGSFHDTISITGYQIGERFGHSLCSVDINGDGYDDVVVGAPLHTQLSTVLSTYKHSNSLFHYSIIYLYRTRKMLDEL